MILIDYPLQEERRSLFSCKASKDYVSEYHKKPMFEFAGYTETRRSAIIRSFFRVDVASFPSVLSKHKRVDELASRQGILLLGVVHHFIAGWQTREYS